MTVPKLVRRQEKGRRAEPSHGMEKLSHQASQVQACGQMIAAMSNQAADIQCGLNALVATHRTIAFLDPPTDGPFIGVVGAVQNRISFAIFPGAIKGEARPEVPAVEEQFAQAIGETGSSAFPGSGSRDIPFIEGLHFVLLLRLARMDQFSQTP